VSPNANNISGKIDSSPAIAQNSRSVNLILFLFLISYFIVGADLSKEIARERGEFKFFTAILTSSQTVDTFFYLDYLVTDPPLVGKVIDENFIPKQFDDAEPYRSRAPPQLV
jgi:hypothetical protein